MTADVFISFASKDHKVAMTLCQSLERRGVKCWISARDILPGENFQVAIVQAIRRARILLLVFTANSNNSEEMTKELALASQQKMIVIPLRVEDVTPNDAFAYEFATRQWIDAFADWEFAIDQLVQRISNALEAQAPSAAASAPAVEPHPPAPAVLALGEIVRKAKAGAHAAPEPQTPELEAAVSEEITGEAPGRRPMGKLLMIAAALAAVVGLGLVVPNLLAQREKPATPMLAVARLEPVPAAAAPVAAPAPVEVAPEVEKPEPPKRKPRKPKPEAHSTDIPY